MDGGTPVDPGNGRFVIQRPSGGATVNFRSEGEPVIPSSKFSFGDKGEMDDIA